MITTLPAQRLHGPRVPAPDGRGRVRGPDGASFDPRRGAALLIAVIVLTAMFLLAVPFAAYMRRQHATSTQAVQMAKARFGEAGALAQARTVLYRGVDVTEAAAATSANPDDFFPFNDPDVDTLWEFRVTLRTRTTSPPGPGNVNIPVEDAVGLPRDGDPGTIDGFVMVDDGTHREWMGYSDITGLSGASKSGSLVVRAENRGLFGTAETDFSASPAATVSFFPASELWHLDVEDPQSKINLNTAPYQVILNLLGYLGIGDSSAGAAPRPGDLNFPDARQLAIASALSSYRLYYSYWNTADDIPDGAYTRFQNLNMLRNISVAPWFVSGGGDVDPLTPEELDLLRPYVTVVSSPPAGSTWFSVASLTDDLNPAAPAPGATYEWAARVSDVSKVPLGSIVRLEDTSNPTQEPVMRQVTAVSPDLTLTQDIDGNITDWVTVSGPVWELRFVRPSSNPSVEPHTPAYLLVEGEWVGVSDVDVPGSRVRLSERGAMGSAAVAHPSGVPMSGNVISWRYCPHSMALPAEEYVPAVVGTFAAVTTEVSIENRHAININTVTSDIVLKSILFGMWDGQTDATGNPDGDHMIDEAEAETIADYLLAYTSGEAGPPRDWFDGDEDWIDGTDGPGPVTEGLPPWGGPRDELNAIFAQLETDGNVTTFERDMLIANFDAQVPAGWPAVSTVPLRFSSGTIVALSSLGLVDDLAGTPVAQSPALAVLKRAYDTVPPLEAFFWSLRSQKEFLDWITATFQGAPTLRTAPLRDDLAVGLLTADSRYDDLSDGVGTVAPGVGELAQSWYTTLLEGLHESPPSFDLDYSVAADTPMLGPATPNVNNTTAGGTTDVQLSYRGDYAGEAVAGRVPRHIQADSFLATVQPFAVEFWAMAPEDMADGEEQCLFAIGEFSGGVAVRAPVQVLMRRVGGEDGARLVFRLADGVTDNYAELVSSIALQPNVWHHVAVAACGTGKTEMAIFLDGIYDTQAEWQFYDDTGQLVGTPQEGYLWPVAMNVPDRKFTLAADAGPGAVSVTVNEGVDEVPPRGVITINSGAQAYEYVAINRATRTFTLAAPLTLAYLAGQPLAVAVPVVRPAVHEDSNAGPAIGDAVAFVGHENVSNGALPGSALAVDSFRMASVDGPATIGSVTPLPADPTPEMQLYVWLGFDPNEYPLTSDSDGLLDVTQERWKVLGPYGASPPEFTGELPCLRNVARAGSNDSDQVIIGARPDGTEPFTGELDEVRISSLPSLVLDLTGAGGTPATVPTYDWQWVVNTDILATDVPWAHAVLLTGATNAMATMQSPAVTPLQATGGYFVFNGDAYAYDGYVWNAAASRWELVGVREVEPDLDADPAGAAGLKDAVSGLRRIIPLNFVPTTRLDGAYNAGDLDIPVLDSGAFPTSGYVKIDDEIIAYSSKGTHPVTGGDGLMRDNACFPRGAYGTLEAGHSAGALVRLLPVREPDRYREDNGSGIWSQHVLYSDAELASADLSCFKYTVNHAGSLSRISWRFRNPLGPDQRVAVLALVDDDDTDGDGRLWSEMPASVDAPRLRGLVDGSGIQEDQFRYDAEGVASKVEVRFYFDLSQMPLYNFYYDSATDRVMARAPQPIPELDRVKVEMAPQPAVF